MDENPTSESSDHEETFQNFEVIRRESAINCQYSEIFAPNPDRVTPCEAGHILNFRRTSEGEYSTYSYEGPWLTENTVLEHEFIHVENSNRNEFNNRYFNTFNIETKRNFIVYDGSTLASVEECRETYTLTKKEEFCEHVSYSNSNIDVDDSDGTPHYAQETGHEPIQHSEEEFEESGAEYETLSENTNEASVVNENDEDYYRIHVYNQTYVVNGQYVQGGNSNANQAQRKLSRLEQEAYAKLRRNLKLHKREYKRRLLVNDVNKVHTRKFIDKNYDEELNIIENDIRKRKVSMKESLMAQLEEEKQLLKSERHLKLSDDPALVRLAAYYRKLRKRTSEPVVKEELPRSLNLLLDAKEIEEDLKVIVESCQSESETEESSSSCSGSSSSSSTSSSEDSDDYTSEE